MILFEDETDVLLFPPLRSNWYLKGHSKEVRLSGANAKKVLFGAINIKTGHRVFMVRPKQRSEDFREFLDEVHRQYRSWHVIMILDADNSHVAYASQDYATYLGIELVWLPYRSPELNPMEGIWRDAKQMVCANRQYENINDEVTKFLDYIESMSNEEALKKSGLRSEEFWLFQ